MRNRVFWPVFGVLALGMGIHLAQPSPLFGILETVGFLFGILWIWFLIQENPWCWPAGIISSGTYVVFLLQSHLFGDAALNSLYVILGGLGWYWWIRGQRPDADFRVSRASLKMLVGLSVLALAGAAVLAPYFQRAGSDVAVPDALLFTFALMAQFLQTRKKIENWPIWIVVDFGYAAVMVHKGYPPTAVLNIVYGALAIQGWLDWRNRPAADEPKVEAKQKPGWE